MANLVPLMLVPLIIWVAVWGYLWTLDNKVKNLVALHDHAADDEEA